MKRLTTLFLFLIIVLNVNAQVIRVYKPESGKFWDHWLYYDGDSKEYHLYYLYMPIGEEKFTIAHATSFDLLRWKEQGMILKANKNHWIDGWLATGSVIKVEDRYAMILTAHMDKDKYPAGEAPALAWSDDLYTWEFDDHGPLVLPEDLNGQVEGPQEWGTPDNRVCGWADPYVFQKENDSKYYFLLNARVNEGEKLGRGRALVFSSVDMYNWNYEGPLDSPHGFIRMETPQIINRDGRWYLIFSSGEKLISEQLKKKMKGKTDAAAFVLTANNFWGPYKLQGHFALFPNTGCYIVKIIADPNGIDRVMTITEGGLSKAYRVSYPKKGGILVHEE